jgi:ABC-type antimicrobial peptide transport system permease subunit
MMAAPLTANRSMFWRIVRRLLFAHRGRLFVILLALGAGAAVTAALLNLQIDAKRRITSEFRAFGANVFLTPRESNSNALQPGERTIDAAIYERIPRSNGYDVAAAAKLLYGIVQVSPWDVRSQVSDSRRALSAVLVGYQLSGNDLGEIFPSTILAEPKGRVLMGVEPGLRVSSCELGEQLAKRLGVQVEQFVELQANGSNVVCDIGRIRRFGGPEDGQILMWLDAAQELLRQPGRLTAIALRVPGNPGNVQQYLETLQSSLPDVEVRPLRQFTEGEARIYCRISSLLNVTVVIVLLLTGLCVMAAMTNVAMERRNDVGLMKAIGGATRRVLRLFLMEAALLGIAGGVIGAAAGIFLSIWLGKQVFGVAAQPRLIVYPIAVGLTIMVAILSAYPLRRLASVRPASVFRGEA